MLFIISLCEYLKIYLYVQIHVIWRVCLLIYVLFVKQLRQNVGLSESCLWLPHSFGQG